MKSELKVKLVAFIITAVILTGGILKNNVFNTRLKQVERNQILAMESYVSYDIESDLNSFIDDNKDVFEFYSDMFGISMDDLKNNIIKDNEGKTLNKSDLGNSNTIYDSLDKNLIDYLFKLKKTNSKLFKQKYSNGKEYNKDYVYGLLNYFSNVYGNVDYTTLASIAYIESGNLNSNYMMSCNNIYGGMSSNGLIKYQNIEFGVLNYVKLMSQGYYAKGLDTVEKIAKVYNPNSNTWVGNVRSTMNKFSNYEKIEDLNTLKNLKGDVVNG